MTEVINNVLNEINLFQPESYKNMTIIGFNIPEENPSDLMSLEIGLDLGLVEITEINEGGDVGQVKVINNAVTPLLLLDGEEIIGSKQNRIVNSTIIIPAKSEKNIPVSCTEAGRWNYNSNKFHYSNHMASSRVRRDKLSSVSESLRNSNTFRSNQMEVWKNIEMIEDDLNLINDTSALHDSYNKKSSDIQDYKNAFKIHEKQNGLIVYINGRLVGFEIIYNSTRYKEYHDKLVESYIIDALSKENQEYEKQEFNENTFINRIKESKCEKFDSVGLGIDYRLENEDLTGSAVIYKDNLINASFFTKIES